MKGEKDERALSQAISAFTAEFCGWRQERQHEFEWVRSRCGLATKHDLEQMEMRLTKAIGKSAEITPSLEAAFRSAQSALDKLDALIPDER